jgi:hypothetical protein
MTFLRFVELLRLHRSMLSQRAIHSVGALTIAATVFVETPAHAQASDNVAAEALFEDARTLVAAGKYAEACPKFADSERLGPSPATLLNLANCYEKLGRTASAWATYRAAASAANAAGRRDYLTTAQRRADGLSTKLARLTVTVAQPVTGLQVKRDGVLVDAAEWGIAIPIDVGSHSVEAAAPGHKAWAVAIQVAQDGAQAAVTIPTLEEAPADATAAAVPATPPATPSSVSTSSPTAPNDVPSPEQPIASSGGAQRAVALVVAGVGVVGLGVGTVFAISAKNKYNDSIANGQCPNPNDLNVCNATGVAERNDARSAGNIATVAFGVGAAALVAGGVLWFTAPHGSRPANAAFEIAPTLGGFVARGAW